MTAPTSLGTKQRDDALAIWWAGVEAVQPQRCIADFFQTQSPFGGELQGLHEFERVLVVGGGKAGAAMAAALEMILKSIRIDLSRVHGLVNVPNETVIPLESIRLHPSRPLGINQPTEAAMEGTRQILELTAAAGPNDLLICLISGGGSALLPAPVEGVSLADKQAVTKLLHECGATIQEMNAVRKHLSKIKGGGLVRHFHGRCLVSLIISDVIGDPLDVIASGPTCPDPTTFGDAIAVLAKFDLTLRVPQSVIAHLKRGRAWQESETLKAPDLADLPFPIHNCIIANNDMALASAASRAEALGYVVRNFGSHIEGETQTIAESFAKSVREVHGLKFAFISGGETTVTLGSNHGKGGRNQEFVLAFLNNLGKDDLKNITVLSGGTDGEDGPTDAAGAWGDQALLLEAEKRGLQAADFLRRHDAYHFFEPLGGLIKTGPTHTNVMDLRVILIDHL